MIQMPHKPLRPRRRIGDEFNALLLLDVPAHSGGFELSSEGVTKVTRVALGVVCEKVAVTRRSLLEPMFGGVSVIRQSC